MNVEELKIIVNTALSHPLPGEAAQLRLAPSQRVSLKAYQEYLPQARRAAVLALFENRNDEAQLIVTRRRDYHGVHSGQISLPGGKREKFDQDYLATALRETREEIGVGSEQVEIAGALSELYIPPSNFLVYPYLGFATESLRLIPEEAEVKTIHHVPLSRLLEKGSLKTTTVKARQNSSLKAPAFVVDDLVIWGATAMIISEIVAMIENKIAR